MVVSCLILNRMFEGLAPDPVQRRPDGVDDGYIEHAGREKNGSSRNEVFAFGEQSERCANNAAAGTVFKYF